MKIKTQKGSVKPQYTASIKILGRTYTSIGSDLRMAIEALQVGKVAGVSILEVTHGKNKKSVVLSRPQTFRIFSSSGMVKEISMKQLLMRFENI